MKKNNRLIPTLAVFAVSLASTLAQSVGWNLPGPVEINKPLVLELVFIGCSPQEKIETIKLPKIDGILGLQYYGFEERSQLTAFKITTDITIRFIGQPTQPGKIQIPSFSVETDKGKMNVRAIEIEATAASAPQARVGQGSNPSSNSNPGAPQSRGSTGLELETETFLQPTSPFVGEVSELLLRIKAPRIPGIEASPISRPIWSPAKVVSEPWQELKETSPGLAETKSVIMFTKEGPAEISPIKMTWRIFRVFFAFPRQQLGDLDVISSPQNVEVMPLPPGVPNGFKGAVGQFTLESKMVPEEVNEGEPITWTLSLKGTGNWPMGVELPGLTVPAKMRTIQPKLRREFDGTQVFTGGLVEDLVLISTEAGEYELPR